MNKIIRSLMLVLSFQCLSSNLFAQKKEFKFGKITQEDFNAKPFGKDSSAAAVKIFDVGECYFQYTEDKGFVYIFERHMRYKIINKNAFDLADFEIPLYVGNTNSKEDLLRMEAATYNLDGDKTTITKLGKGSKFTEEYNKNYSIKKYTLANIKEGSVIEYKYSITSNAIFNLRGWNFQSEIPTLYSEYTLTIPQYLVYKPTFSGFHPLSQTKSETIVANYVQDVNSNAQLTKYFVINAPALKKEAFITTMDDYTTSIDFELMSTHYPNEGFRDYTGTWPKVIAMLADYETFGGFIKRNSLAKTILPTLIKAETDSLKIAHLIYTFVKDNIKWNDKHRLFTTEANPKNIFEQKAGSSADINLILLSLLNEAKLKANPILISTRQNGAHPGIPNISKFNSVLVNLFINGTNYTLDATNKDHFFGMTSYQSLNHEGFIVDLKNKNGSWMSIEPAFKEEKNYIFNLTLNTENKLQGVINQSFKGYGALSLRDRYRSSANEGEYIKALKKDKLGLEIEKYQISNLNSFDEVLHEQMHISLNESVEEAGNLVYLNPLFFERTKENLLKNEERNFPVDFGYPFKETIRTVINFPSEYEIEKLPTGGVYKLPDNKGSFSINFITQDKTVLIRSSIDINKSRFSPEEYFDVKELFKLIVEKQAEQVVFKKKS